VTSFFAKPLVDFLSLRSQVHEEIIFTGNISPMVAGTADHLKAVESLRRLGAKVPCWSAFLKSALRPLQSS
jgi:hypothetical protein